MNVTHLAVGRNGRQRIHTGWMLQITDSELADLIDAVHTSVRFSRNATRNTRMNDLAAAMERARDDFADTERI